MRHRSSAYVLPPDSTAADYIRFVSRLAPIPCREDLALTAQRFFNFTGLAVEVHLHRLRARAHWLASMPSIACLADGDSQIGVLEGFFARYNLQRGWEGTYYAVDAWGHRPNDDSDDNNSPDAEIHNRNYRKAAENLAPFKHRAHLMRSLSVPAASRFPDGNFDWIFIDALHTHRAVVQDLHAWWAKLRVGGLFSGDDYGDLAPTDYLNHERQVRAQTICCSLDTSRKPLARCTTMIGSCAFPQPQR